MTEPRPDLANVDAVVSDDTEGHRLAANDNETTVADDDGDPKEPDTEGHRLASNDNETIVDNEAG